MIIHLLIIHHKLKITATKVSIEDFYLVDMA
jgi:hypothetical protein